MATCPKATDVERVDAADLRHRMVDDLRARAVVTSPAVEAALRVVPRHVFVPEVPPERAYADEAVVTKVGDDGMPTSSASQPSIVGLMLEQLDVARGHRVLEIGAGTGYNAALLAELVGPEGAVTTVDLDADVVERARPACGTQASTRCGWSARTAASAGRTALRTTESS